MVKEQLAIGTIVRLHRDPAQSFTELLSLGMKHFQFGGPPDKYIYGEEGAANTEALRETMSRYGVECTSVFLGFNDQDWSRPEETVGLVPPAYRSVRLVRACREAVWAKSLGIDELVTHVGFVPEDRQSAEYIEFIRDLHEFVRFLDAMGMWLNFETGQETVEVLGNMIEDLDMPNLGINLDPANLLIYDVDGPDVLVSQLGRYVRHLHCKDAVRPTEPGKRGRETPLGQGDTDFVNVLKSLLDMGFRGPLIIEREIAPSLAWKADLANAVALLKGIKKEAGC